MTNVWARFARQFFIPKININAYKMSSRKRKQKFPEKKSEGKRAKMTWSMTDLAKSVSDESGTPQFIPPSLQQDKAATRRRRVASPASTGVPANLELKLENTYSKQNVCQLGCFSICLCTSKEQEDEMRMNGTNVSTAHLVEEWNFDHRNFVIVRLAFETPILSTTLPEIRDCCDQGSTSQDEVDILKQVSFKATVPNVKHDIIEALVYLQDKGTISLVLKPEQGILKDNWEVVVCLNESGLSRLSFASEEPTSRKIDKMMKDLISWFYDSFVETGVVMDSERGLIADKGFNGLFDSIKAVQKKASSAAADTNKQYCVSDRKNEDLVVPDVQHPDLKPVLRGYQRKAVEWMLRREYGCSLGEHIADDYFVHPLWREIHTLDEKLVYFNPHTGRLTKECFPPPLLPLGGILADEMGLGKTVEVIACILCHPKPTSDPKLPVVVESGTALQKLSNPETIIEENLLSSCKMGGEKPTTAQIEPSRHQALSNSSTMNLEHKSESACHGTTMQSSLASGSVNANKAREHKLLETNGSSKLTECVTSSKATNCVTTHSDMKFLNHDKISDVKGCLDVKLTSPCESQTRQNSHASPVKLDSCCDVSGQQGSNASQIASSFCKVTEDNHEVGETISRENNISVLNDINYNAASSVCLGSENFEMFSKENDGALPPHAVVSSCRSLESSRDVLQCHANDKGRLQPEVIITQHNHNSNADETKDTVPSKNDQDFADKSSLSSGLALKETASIKCQCVCGVTSANFSDMLLNCCECRGVFHAKCLTYDCPKEFICPPCALKQPAVPSGATLIISPAPIAQQWIDEIIRHTQPSSLKLLVYKGVAKSGFILPEVLADHDVILTTYTTLRSDFYHIGRGNASDRSMRYNKRYVSLPSPLTSVLFWRICLDEAQMVESTTAKAAEVALHLQSVHRWCVTGTPIQRDLADIYGLLLFLGVDPYCNQTWWKTLLYEPYRQGKTQPLCNLLAKIMWRSTKKDVIQEIQLPHQDEKVKWLMFSPVEQHFYRRQHEECAGFAMRLLSHWRKTDTMLSTIDRHTVNQLLNPLLRLRQACCHPQAVRGGYLSVQKSTLTMDKLLENLISKAKLECEEAHRQLLFAFNGLAGIHLLKEEWADAVNMYREAMRSWMEHETTFRTDALQKLHTLYNLSDILSHHEEQCSRTLRDDKLQDEVKELKSNYTIRVNVQVTSAQENLKTVKSSTGEMMKKVDFHSPWWMEVLHYASSKGLGEDLCHRIRDELSTTDVGSIGRFANLHGLQYLLLSKLDLIESTHQNLLVELDKLTVMPSTQMVQASAACCLRPADNSQAERCAFCEVDDIFTEYESRIFGHQGMKGVDNDQDLQADKSFDWHRHGNTGGLRAESEVEKVLKVIHNFIKTNKISPTAQQEGRNHLNLIEGLKKEFKFLRALWFALRERVSCLDELDMCTTRLRLQLPGEPATDDIHVVHPLQLDQQRLKFTSDRIVAQTELRKKMGQLLYLNNLAKTQTCHDGKNPDPCPVCVKQLGVQWSVFSCGHCICCQCAWVLLRQSGIGPRNRNVHVKCPLCRVPTVAQEISYVSTAKSQGDEANNDITVKGSHSTKVEAVVRTLLTIKSADSTAKCLVFSTWQDVLSVVAKALDENDISYRHITSGSKQFQENLQTFKKDPLLCVLLLPLQTGSNGLNLIEATHVLLVEPALNPAHELQAVGRVHRIGQTKPTHVYRFIIRGTVESRMYSLLQSKPTGCVRPGARDTENSSLTLGDLASLFTQEDEKDEELCMTGIYGSSGPEGSPEQL